MLSQAVPVLPSQLTAACRLYARLTSWSATDNAFRILRERVPGWDVEAALLKTAAVNQLYWTQIRLVSRMAVHVAEVMKDPPTKPELLVEAIASLPPREGRKQFLYCSFASKMCHFFVDQDKFPIYDGYSRIMVRYHLGRQAPRQGNPYATFVADVARLLDLSERSASSTATYGWQGSTERTCGEPMLR